MRLAFSKAVLATIQEKPYNRLYVNVARFKNGEWGLCWYPQWLGATNFRDAVRLRREWLADLRKTAPDVWPLNSVKTIRVF